MAKEISLWNWLKKSRLLYRRSLHLCRVENSSIKGMPDVEGQVIKACPFWIELKSAKRPAKSTTPVRFPTKDREAQVEWAKRRSEVGGRCYMLLQVGSGSDRRIYLVHGLNSQKVHDGLTEQELKRLNLLRPGKPKPEDIIWRCSGATLVLH